MTMPRFQTTAALKTWCAWHMGDPHLCVIIKCNVRVFLKETVCTTIDNIRKYRYWHVELWLAGCSPAPTGGGGKGNLRTSWETCNIGCTVTVTYLMWCNDWSVQQNLPHDSRHTVPISWVCSCSFLIVGWNYIFWTGIHWTPKLPVMSSYTPMLPLITNRPYLLRNWQ